MKAFLGGVITAVLIAIAFGMWRSVRDAEWLIMSIKSPGIMGLRDIQSDMDAKRYDLAKEKIDILLKIWERFSQGPDSCSGTGIRDIVPTFLEMSGGIRATNVEPDGPANGSQPIRSETNQTSSAAGSRR